MANSWSFYVKKHKNGKCDRRTDRKLSRLTARDSKLKHFVLYFFLGSPKKRKRTRCSCGTNKKKNKFTLPLKIWKKKIIKIWKNYIYKIIVKRNKNWKRADIHLFFTLGMLIPHQSLSNKTTSKRPTSTKFNISFVSSITNRPTRKRGMGMMTRRTHNRKVNVNTSSVTTPDPHANILLIFQSRWDEISVFHSHEFIWA